MGDDIAQIFTIGPHAKGGMLAGLGGCALGCLAACGHENRPLLTTIEDGDALVAIEGLEDFGHATAQIENGGLHGFCL